jgi:hypothetical protein
LEPVQLLRVNHGDDVFPEHWHQNLKIQIMI